jgi:hypothetical protein
MPSCQACSESDLIAPWAKLTLVSTPSSPWYSDVAEAYATNVGIAQCLWRPHRDTVTVLSLSCLPVPGRLLQRSVTGRPANTAVPSPRLLVLLQGARRRRLVRRGRRHVIGGTRARIWRGLSPRGERRPRHLLQSAAEKVRLITSASTALVEVMHVTRESTPVVNFETQEHGRHTWHVARPLLYCSFAARSELSDPCMRDSMQLVCSRWKVDSDLEFHSICRDSKLYSSDPSSQTSLRFTGPINAATSDCQHCTAKHAAHLVLIRPRQAPRHLSAGLLKCRVPRAIEADRLFSAGRLAEARC